MRSTFFLGRKDSREEAEEGARTTRRIDCKIWENGNSTARKTLRNFSKLPRISTAQPCYFLTFDKRGTKWNNKNKISKFPMGATDRLAMTLTMWHDFPTSSPCFLCFPFILRVRRSTTAWHAFSGKETNLLRHSSNFAHTSKHLLLHTRENRTQ